MHTFGLPLLLFLGFSAAASDFSANYRYDKDETRYDKLPKLSQLPRVPGHLPGSAWLWGEEDGV